MKTYVWLTFGLMGWIYYEASGGAGFEPQQPQTVAMSEPDVTPDVVARADTTSLLSVSTSNIDASPEPAIVQTVAEVEPVSAPVEPVTPITDLREILGSRVNMRTGPGTDYDVIATLDGGTTLEVIDVDANGWAQVVNVEMDMQGWMAARLLSDPQT